MNLATGMHHYIVIPAKNLYLYDVHYVRAVKLNQFPSLVKMCSFCYRLGRKISLVQATNAVMPRKAAYFRFALLQELQCIN